ncbi:MAG: phage tail family protein [Erysipelotrichaceae bacterium]
MQFVKFTNELNEVIDFNIEGNYILASIEGTGNVSAIHNSIKNVYQNGARRTNTNLDVRYMKLNGTIKACNRSELARLKEYFCEVFNPLLNDGRLEYNAGNGTKYINTIAEDTPIFSEYNGDYVKFIVDLVCHDPFWHDFELNEHVFSTPYTSTFQFPHSFNTPTFQMGYQTETREFENTGGVRVPLLLEFEGGVKNVKFTNKTNGEWIEFKKKLNSNETLIINSGQGCKEIAIVDYLGNERSGFSLLTFDCSTFIHLEKGKNIINFVAESDNSLAKVKIKWIPSYLGV